MWVWAARPGGGGGVGPMSLLAYNMVNLWRRLVLPKRIGAWSLTSSQQRLVKTGGRLVKHARYCSLLLVEGDPHRRLFGQMLRRIWALPVPSGQHSGCGCKIWGRRRRVGGVSIGYAPASGARQTGKNEPSEPRLSRWGLLWWQIRSVRGRGSIRCAS
jgi:hypothetical protein